MRLLTLLVLAALLPLLPTPARAETVRIAVLHTTDVHGSLAAWDDLADRPAPCGLEKIASMVRAVRAEGAPVLLLDDGDAIEGSPLTAIDHRDGGTGPDPVTSVMSLMGYDAMAVGNHEFSWGPGGRERARRSSTFPWLAANVTGPGGRPAFGASIVKVLGGVRVGVVGLTTPAVPAMEDSANWQGLAFGSPVDAARREVGRLRRSERCDVVIVLAHTGLERDPATGAARHGDTPDENWGWRLANEVPGVDLLILGHTHVVIPSLPLGGTLVTQAGRGAEDLGRVDLELTRPGAGAPWSLTSRHAAVIAVTDSVPADSAVALRVRPVHEAARRALDEPLGEAAAEIGAPHGRFDDGSLWELIQLAQLEATGAEVSLAALPDPAARIGPGRITLRDVYRAYPYGNTLDVVEITGGALRRVLEQSARYLAPYTYSPRRPLAEPDMPGYNFDAAEGVGYEIDLTRPAGERIVALTYRNQPLDSTRVLKVAVNSYRANGGGGFAALRGAPCARTGRDVREAIAARIRRLGRLDGSFARNWRLLPDYAASPERPLIDRLVRQGAIPREDVHRLEAFEPARRGDLAYWLARAWGWRESRLSGAFADVPDSLEPWLDGLLKRGVLGDQASLEWIQPFAVVGTGVALDWCTAAAHAGSPLRLTAAQDGAFRRGLLAGIQLPRARTRRGVAIPDTLTRAQVLAMVANARFPVLRVLETTDFHGAILPGAKDRRSGRALGGSAVLAAWVEKLRAENPEGTVILDGGDCFQGTMISNLQYGRPVVEQMNALGYAACAVGNHDFDWTADTLTRRARESRYAELGANCLERKTGRIPKPMTGDTLVVRRGLRVDILGLCYRNTPTVTLASNVAHLRFEDDSATAAQWVPRLRRRDRPDVMLVVGHIPAESDSARHARGGDLPRLARVPGVDAFFGGHSHNLVDDQVNGVPMMIAGSHGQCIAICDLTVDPVRHRVVERETRLQTTWADEVTPDSAWIARVERWDAAVGPIARQPVGRSARALGRGGPESPVGDLVADAMRLKSGTDVALQNSGGLRADLPEGVLTKGDLYAVMPFDNTIYIQELTGSELRLALEQGLRRDRVTQVSGIRWSFDPSRPPLQRVLSLTLADGSPVQDTVRYRVACNNFMATGGDEYDVLSHGRNRHDTGLTVRDALEELVIARSRSGPMDVRTDGRIVRLGEAR